jgi:hypothetical protein
MIARRAPGSIAFRIIPVEGYSAKGFKYRQAGERNRMMSGNVGRARIGSTEASDQAAVLLWTRQAAAVVFAGSAVP